MAAHHRMLGPDCVPLLLERLEGCLMGNDPCLRWSLLHMTTTLRWGGGVRQWTRVCQSPFHCVLSVSMEYGRVSLMGAVSAQRQ